MFRCKRNVVAIKYISCFAEGDKSKKQGAYLYFDRNNCTWIRSGKVTGRGFSVRHAEHQKKAAAKKTASRFYLRYPTKSSARCKSSSRKGYFDNLTQYVALGFDIDLNNERGETLTIDMSENGIFSFDENKKKRIDVLKFRGRNTTTQKRVDVIAYLIELCYDIAISPANNVSQNPGFESCLGIW